MNGVDSIRVSDIKAHLDMLGLDHGITLDYYWLIVSLDGVYMRYASDQRKSEQLRTKNANP